MTMSVRESVLEFVNDSKVDFAARMFPDSTTASVSIRPGPRVSGGGGRRRGKVTESLPGGPRARIVRAPALAKPYDWGTRYLLVPAVHLGLAGWVLRRS